jgi:hypothetical protein
MKDDIFKGEDLLPIVDKAKLYQEKYGYGSTREQLIPWLHYPNPTWWGSVFAWTTTISTVTTTTITWVGFTPKMIEINARVNWTNTGFSDWVYFWGGVSCRYVYWNWTTLTTWWIGYSSYVQSGANSSITTTITPTSDWFTIVSADVSAWALQIIYKCY